MECSAGYSSYLGGGARGERGGGKYGSSDRCPRCGGAVYMAEKIVGAGSVGQVSSSFPFFLPLVLFSLLATFFPFPPHSLSPSFSLSLLPFLLSFLSPFVLPLCIDNYFVIYTYVHETWLCLHFWSMAWLLEQPLEYYYN